MHVINAAKKIAEAGSKLDKLARSIADLVRNALNDLSILQNQKQMVFVFVRCSSLEDLTVDEVLENYQLFCMRSQYFS